MGSVMDDGALVSCSAKETVFKTKKNKQLLAIGYQRSGLSPVRSALHAALIDLLSPSGHRRLIALAK